MKQYPYAYYHSKLQGDITLMAFDATIAPVTIWCDGQMRYKRCSAVVLAENDEQARTLLAEIEHVRSRLAALAD